MERIKRVFFHELGHFVARELNYIHFNGTGSAEIKIYPCREEQSEYCGHITPILPEGVLESDRTAVPIDRLAEHLASDLYGCIFQSYYLNTGLETCTKTNGKDDIKDWIGSLYANKLSFLNTKISPLSIKHLELLKSQKLLDQFMKLTPEEYLIEAEEKHFSVNLEKLRRNTCILLVEHGEYYKKFVEQHQAVINENSTTVT